MRGSGGDGMEVCRRWAGPGVGTTIGELGSVSARAGGLVAGAVVVQAGWLMTSWPSWQSDS